MRLRLTLILALVGLVTCFTQPVAGSVPVPNGDMEKGQDTPEGWTLYVSGHAESAWETQVAHSGRRSFRVKKIGNDGFEVMEIGGTPLTMEFLE